MKVHPGRVITFYSYKGGVGRTQALVSCACGLASWGWRVLVVDFDLEAPGVDRYLRRWAPRLRHEPGLVDLILEPGLDWRAAVSPVQVMSRPDAEGVSEPVAQGEGVLHVLHAGRTDDGRYAERLHRIDWKVMFPSGLMDRIEAWREDWQEEYDFILIDSRTGLSDSAGVSTVQLPEILVVLFTANEQSLAGALDVARSAQRLQDKLPLSRARLRVVPVPTRIDASEYRLQEDWVLRIAEDTRALVEEWSERETFFREDMLRYLRAVTTPYVPFWSYGEEVPWVEESAGTRFSLVVSHEAVARMLAVGLEVSAAWDVPEPQKDLMRHLHPARRWNTRPRQVTADSAQVPPETVEQFITRMSNHVLLDVQSAFKVSNHSVMVSVAVSVDLIALPSQREVWRDLVVKQLMKAQVHAPDEVLSIIGHWRTPSIPEFYRDLAQRVAGSLLSEDERSLWNTWFDELLLGPSPSTGT